MEVISGIINSGTESYVPSVVILKTGASKVGAGTGPKVTVVRIGIRGTGFQFTDFEKICIDCWPQIIWITGTGRFGVVNDTLKLYDVGQTPVIVSSGFPLCDLTHDGTIMAYNISAKVTGKEWNDGSPASAKNSGSCYDNWHGQIEERPSTTSEQVNYHLGVDMNYIAYVTGGPVSMGPFSSKPEENSASTISTDPYLPEAFRQAGPPPRPSEATGFLALFAKEQPKGPPDTGSESVGGSTAGMAIHKSEGLVPIDETGLSSIPGLCASGDALGSYMSGGMYTQIGSSTAGSAIQGVITGEAAAIASQAVTRIAVPEKKMLQTKDEILAPLKRESGYSAAWVTQILQSVMIPNFVLYIKKERLMQAALAYVEELKEHHGPMLMASDRHHLRLAHESMNMMNTAEMRLKASIMCTESRCSHYRLGFPDIDYENWQAWINIYKNENGEMMFEKQYFDKLPEFA